MNKYEYLKDSSFLEKIDRLRIKEQFIKITVLNFQEKPIQEIQGKVIGGSINLDGDSSIRRTCSLNMITEDYTTESLNPNGLLSLNKKVSIEIGFTNITNYYKNYDIIWFPLGIYVIINSSITNSDNGLNISLQLKDKMCLLNGECGGVLPASVTFHEYETVNENGEYIIIQPTIYKIILELVNHFGGEQLSKIIISDIDERIKQVMKWTGSTPLYIIKEIKNNIIQYIPTVNENLTIGKEYDRYENGRDIGYIYTDFIYPGELIGDAGNTVCDILDTIKDTLGNYEYFYDINGNFIFQEIKNYLNTTQAKIELNNLKNDNYLLDMSKGKSVYKFDDSTLITSYSNSPQFSMIKNDFIVWGLRKTADGKEVPIRYHLAIDSKPKIGNTYKCFFYEDKNDKITKAKVPLEFLSIDEFPDIGTEGVFYFAKDTGLIYKWDAEIKSYISLGVSFENITTKDWRTELYLSGVQGEPYGSNSNYYYTELLNEWPKLYDVKKGDFFNEVLQTPSDIDYYLDFIDSDSSISDFSVENIGRRSKVVTDDSVNCVFEPYIPDFVLIELNQNDTEELRQECENKGQEYIQVDSSIYNLMTGGGSLNSAYNLVREMLYQYTSYNESVSLQAIPIYHLEPNTRITIRDTKSGIYGDYMIKSISLPLDITSTMSISCNKALEKI